ncbi:MAG: twin-arginine translocase subunit TatC [Micromonosporaceae bacterium]|nr:twin-arginine translocase subunit TatC [Micromonosporaceae bacterium]
MNLVEHLLELRSRLFKATIAVTVGLVVGYFVADPVFALLERPYCKVNNLPSGECQFTWLAPTDPFLQKLKIALWVGLIIAAPFWLYQVWAFVAPGLHRRERRWAYGFGGLAVPLFVAGAVLAYFVVDRGLHFLLEAGLTEGATQLEATRYVSFITLLILVFGLSFQFPVLLLLLNFSGMVSARKLLSSWRVVVFVCFAFAAIFTPDPGPFGMVLLASCLSLLYFAAVGVAFLHDRRKARHEEFADLPDDQISGLDEDLEPVTAGEPVEPAGTVDAPTPLDRRYDDIT